MIDYFSKRFELTEEGSKNLVKSIIYTVLGNISLMFPVGLYIGLLYLLITPLTGGKYIEPNLGIFILAILVVLGIIFILHYRQYYFLYTTTYTESGKRRINLAESLRKLPLAFFENRDLTDLSSTIMNDCTDLEHVFSHAIPQLTGSIITLIIITIGFLTFDWRLTIALLWPVPVSFAVLLIFKSLNEKYSEKLHYEVRSSTDGIQECIESIRDLKSYNYEKKYLNKLSNKFKNLKSMRIKTELALAPGVIIGQMILKLGVISVMLYGASLIVNNEVSIFVFLVYLISSAIVFTPVENALQFLAEIIASNTKIEHMKEINSLVPKESLDNYTLDGYDIEFKDVEFAYNDFKEDSTNTLNNINFTAKQGEVTALIGPSGGGKSTVSKLAAKFWDPDKGSVSLGGVDLANVDSEKILENYSIVFQDVVLFNDTVMENIRIGKKDASDEEVFEAARAAQCDEFVLKLPEGYDTIIGENGALLSGGERQRISIARAILKNAPIILLDEATSFLDVENESLIQKALSSLIQNKTVIIIAHRMRTIANADKIIVLDNGFIVEEGSPEELLENEGIFYKMVNIQNKSINWKIN